MNTAPTTFQRVMDKAITSDLTPYIFSYLDDVIIVSDFFE